MELNTVYVQKVDSCVSAINALGYDVNTLIKKYGNDSFPNNGPKKITCFNEVIEKSLNTETYEYLEEVCSLAHHRDSRRCYEYGIDLILGWLIEDAVLLLLQEKGKAAILSGKDRYREFLSARKISTQPDITVQFQSGERMLEVFGDWKGTWHNQNHVDLRDNKYKKLKEHNAIMFGIAPLTREGFVMDFSKEDRFIENFIYAYRKMGYTLTGVRDLLKPLNEIVNELLVF